MYSSAFRFASLLTLVLLLVLAAERGRLPIAERTATAPRPALTDLTDAVGTSRPERAVVAPVRRVMPKTPPLPEAILLAGDVEEPSRAPDQAPMPGRRDAALAQAHLAGEAATAVAAETVVVPVPVAAARPAPAAKPAAPRPLSVAKPRDVDFMEGRMSLKGPSPERGPAPGRAIQD